MDPSLLRERELFKKKALDVPVIETKRKREDDGNDSKKKSGKAGPSTSLQKASSALDFPKSSTFGGGMSAASSYKFGVLTKIVKHLRQKFQDGEDYPLTLAEILDETNQMDVAPKVQHWLDTEALRNNPKIEPTYDKFQFKPPLKCRDKKSLLRLLKQHDMKGLGGIFRDDVIESVPHAERVLKNIDSELITIVRQDKKKVLFYNDRHADLPVDEEFQKNWRAVAVDGIDDAKIEEYLDKQGIRSMQDQGIKKTAQRNPRRKGQRKKQIKKPKDNEHIAGDLETYDE